MISEEELKEIESRMSMKSNPELYKNIRSLISEIRSLRSQLASAQQEIVKRDEFIKIAIAIL